MSKIRLVLADDHPMIREGFKSLLGKSDDFEIVGEAEDGKAMMELVSRTIPDVVLVDITMPLLNGLDAVVDLKKKYADMKFIVLTMHDEQEYVMKALRAGADGYLLKNIERAELEKAIKTVFGGSKFFSPRITSIIAESAVRQPPADQPEITQREREVLSLVAKGQSTKQIADQLGISVRTVESHRINMLKKMNVNNSAELVKKATEMNMLD